MPTRLRRASPDPGLGAEIELLGGDASGLFDHLGIGRALPFQRITAEEASPPLLQIEPARPGRNVDVMDARMIDQPGARLKAVMTAEIVGFDVSEQSDIAFRVA